MTNKNFSCSEIFSNTEEIARELIKEEMLAMNKDSLGFLICNSQIDYERLNSTLSRELTFPIIGGTTLAMPIRGRHDEVSASLAVLEKEHMQHAISVTSGLDEDKSKDQMRDLYDSCIKQLTGKPRLFLIYIPMIHGLMTNKFVDEIFELAGDVPVFGGVTTDDMVSSDAAVFANGKAYRNDIVLVALGGDIRPIFGVGNQLSLMTQYEPVVTKSEDNLVYRVDDMSFCDYMRSLGIAPENRINGVDALMQYGPLPVRLYKDGRDLDGVPEIRCISYTDLDNGGAAFSTNIPEGTRVNMGLIQKSDVMKSAEICAKNLTEQIKNNTVDGYEYTTLIAVPCVARYFAMVGDEAEGIQISNMFPKNLNVTSYYGFSEIGPTFNSQGEIHNRSNNASIIMCAL